MIPFLTEILEFVVAMTVLVGSQHVFKNISVRKAAPYQLQVADKKLENLRGRSHVTVSEVN